MAESRKQSGNNERFYVVRVYGAWLRVDIVCVSIFRRIHAFTDALTVPTGKQEALLFLTLLTERNGMRCRNHRMYCNIISHIRYHENTHIVSHCTLATMLLYIYIWICSQTSKIIRFWRYIVASTPTNGFIYIKHVHVVCTLLQLVYLWHAHLSFCTCSRYTRYITSEHNVCSDFYTYNSIGEDEKILLSKKNKTHVWVMVVNASSAPHHRIGTHVRSLVGHVPGKVKTCNFPEITQTDAHG